MRDFDPRFKVTFYKQPSGWHSQIDCPDGDKLFSGASRTRWGARRAARRYVKDCLRTGAHA